MLFRSRVLIIDGLEARFFLLLSFSVIIKTTLSRIVILAKLDFLNG